MSLKEESDTLGFVSGMLSNSFSVDFESMGFSAGRIVKKDGAVQPEKFIAFL